MTSPSGTAPSNLYWTGNVDHDPAGTQRKTLAVLVASRWPLYRRAIQQQVYGTDRFGAMQTIAALRSLQERKLVASAYDARFGTRARKWEATDAGRAALALVDVLDQGGAA